MAARRDALVPLFAGLAAGAWEGGLVLASYGHNLGPGGLITALLMPSGLYGLLFWLLSFPGAAVFGLARSDSAGRRRLWNWAWVAAALVLSAWLLKSRLITGLGRQPLWAVGGAALSLSLAWTAWRLDRRGGGQALCVVLPALAVLIPGAYTVLGPTTGRGYLPVAQPMGEPAAGAPNLLLITLDTVRADSLPILGGGGLTTPNIDRLAAEGTVFEDLQAVAPVTGPSHASLLTGLYPPGHGLRSNGDRTGSFPTPTLAQFCAEHGYATGGFVSAYPVSARFGFDAGFQIFDDRLHSEARENLLRALFFGSWLAQRLLPEDWQPPQSETAGAITVERTLHWLGGVDRPFFLWLHLYDAHAPYRPPEPIRRGVLARQAEGPRPHDLTTLEGWVLQRGEIEVLDDLIGRVLQGIERIDPGLANTVVALSADHGECFGEGGFRYAHHRSIYQATQHIPGLIRPAPARGPTKVVPRVADTVSQVDYFPTLCELAGLPLEDPSAVHGRSLVALLRGAGEAPNPEGTYLEAYQRQNGDERMMAWRQKPWTLAVDLNGQERLIHDQRGQVPLDEAEPGLIERLRAARGRFLGSIRIVTGETLGDDHGALEGLGYVDH